jgi:hypothetical protein
VRRLLLTGAVLAASLVFALRIGALRGEAASADAGIERAVSRNLAYPLRLGRAEPRPGLPAPLRTPRLDGSVGAPGPAALFGAAEVGPLRLPQAQQNCYFDQSRPPDPGHAFYFTRGAYSSYRGYGRRGGGSWAIDWPKSDCQFNIVLQRLTNLNSYLDPNAVTLDDPALLRYPYVYILEVGRIALSPGEITNLRDFLLKGGFLFVDDFWGNNEWYPFEDAMRQVLPEYPIEPLPLDHEYFHTFYDVEEIHQVPNVNNARYGVTTECGGCYPEVYGIFDDKRRLMVVINWNTDLGDAWEWAERPDYPVRYSTYAFEVGVNAIIYAMSH